MTTIVRYAEIGLKGKNRVSFEKRLVENIEKCLKHYNIVFEKITRPRGRILVHTDDSCKQLSLVFGIASFSNAKVFDSFDEIADFAASLVKGKTFCVRCQRLDKSYSKNSSEVEREIGAKIVEKTGAKVKLKNPDIEVGIEIIDGKLYVFTEKNRGLGGMPVGSQGKVVVFVDKPEANIAGLLMMKRGCLPIIAKMKDIDVSLLKEFMPGLNIEEKSVDKIEEALALAEKVRGMVIADTIDKITKIETDVLVLRPLLTVDIQEIKNDFIKAKEAKQN
jgi:adenylyl- and sulfurtransferase ThiI